MRRGHPTLVARRPLPAVLAARTPAACRECVPDGAASREVRFRCVRGIATPLARRRRTPLTERTPDGARRLAPFCVEHPGDDVVRTSIVSQEQHDGWLILQLAPAVRAMSSSDISDRTALLVWLGRQATPTRRCSRPTEAPRTGTRQQRIRRWPTSGVP